ncbi:MULTISPECIES: hypothetical protein [Flavobacterium]|uniref:Lipoprotein n=1 Tax=Flavobacterium hankyongi TaxID=1176532 RepID=A0ABP8ZQZ8_9FLAO|nr:hypothetical protein [Flavobacterium sp. N1846]
MGKVLFLTLISSILINCSVKKNEVGKTLSEQEKNIVQECPNGGECSIKYLANKSIKIDKDNTNKIYYNLVDNLEKSVVRFEFKKNNPSGMAEANYIEEIVLEVQNSAQETNLSDEFLEKAKVLFGKYCYCKGQAGVYLIQTGSLKIKQDREEISIELNFDMSPITHKVSKIKYLIKK